MNKIFALAAVAALALASAASAQSLQFRGGLAGTGGLTGNWSGAQNMSQTMQFGGAVAHADGEAYGMSESTFQGGYAGNGLTGGIQFQGTTTAGSGSLSNASTASNGNGTSWAGNSGSGFGAGVSLGGAAGLQGGN